MAGEFRVGEIRVDPRWRCCSAVAEVATASACLLAAPVCNGGSGGGGGGDGGGFGERWERKEVGACWNEGRGNVGACQDIRLRLLWKVLVDLAQFELRSWFEVVGSVRKRSVLRS